MTEPRRTSSRSRGGFSGTRRQARERALELLYESESKQTSPSELIASLPLPPDAYAVDLAEGVAANQKEIDELLTRFSKGWRLERMPMIDRLLLRMATFELLHRSDVPGPVAISEAVELAKQYSTEDSGRFVNGVLAAIAQELGKGT